MKVKELIFAGTGASTGLPNVACINRRDFICPVCESALTPEGAKNRRNNTSLVVIVDDKNGIIKNILIDCGKTFYASTLDSFLRHKIRHIDAVILTHGHADAMLGLDDLRPWCSLVASNTIPVYLDQNTMEVVKSAFPYLVDRSKATGGGEVSSLEFNIIDPEVPFNVEGIEFIPLQVEHGFQNDGSPFMSLGFRFRNISYISDTSRIPSSTRKKMLGTRTLILDCLRPKPYSSHFGIDQALDECLQINPSYGFFVGMSHSLDHYKFEALLKSTGSQGSSILTPAYDGLKVSVTETGEVLALSSGSDD